jgi:hypothetical protein
MDRYKVDVKNNAVVVDTSALTTGPDRGAKKYFEPPRGPSCI